ncbi:MAG TPA: hypothetical protein VNG73_07825 [Gemmatimonadaceae bacterium]|jgi:hypothetical protein|nr:hypothetical protein [Gemmatimonadaceae bacterium]
MQKLRAIAVAVTAMIVVSASANAQSVSNFDDSWFWGFKSGINSFSVPGHGNTSTVDLGIDWVITRSKGGLYVSGNQSIFQRDLEFGDPTSQTGQRTVRVNDMRRITLAALGFPKHFGGITPYAGLGFMIAVLGDARVFVDSVNTFPTNAFLDEVENERSRSSAVAMFGVQIQTKRAAVFAQNTLVPSNNTFLFRSVLNFLEFGIRINFGSSIDQE